MRHCTTGSRQARLAWSEAHAFNREHPVGTKVRFWPGAVKGSGKVGKTASAAEVLGGHTAVIWIDGHAGCIALSHVEPIAEVSKLAEALKEGGSDGE